MVSARSRDSSNADIFIEHTSEKQGFILVEDSNTGLLGYRPGVAPLLAPQFRSSGFTYAHNPPEIDLPLIFNDWSKGTGFRDATGGAGSSITTYAYSQGVDSSYRTVLIPSPAEQADGSLSVATGPVQFLWSDEHGIFVVTETTVEERTSDDTWANRQTVATNAEYTSLFEYSNSTDTYLLAAQGGATPANYRVSTDGTTWTQASGTNADAFAYFAIRTVAVGEPVVWGITAAGALRNTQDPSSAGVWTAADQIITQAETVLGMLTGPDNKLYIFTDRHMYRFDGTIIETMFMLPHVSIPLTDETSPNIATLSPTNNIYIRYGVQIFKYNVNDNTMAAIWPRPDSANTGGGFRGPINFVEAASDVLWFTFGTGSNRYLIKHYYDTDEFHAVLYDTSSSGWTAGAILPPQGAATMNSTNRVLALGQVANSAIQFIILADPGVFPSEDSAYRYTTTARPIFGPWVDFGAQTFTKLLTNVELVAENIDSNNTVVVDIELENNQGSFTTLITANAAGSLYTGSASTALEFTRLRYRITIDSGSANATTQPTVRGVALHAAPNPSRKRAWNMDISTGLAQRGGGAARNVARDQDTFLFNALTERITFYDRYGASFASRLIDIQSAGVRSLNGVDHEALTLTVVEL